MSKEKAIEAIAKEICNQAGVNFYDLPPVYQERNRKSAESILSLPEVAEYYKEARR